MSIFDTENIYPDDNFWLENEFFDLKKTGIWMWSGNRHLHWNISDTGTCWGNVRIYVEYKKYSKTLRIFQGESSFYRDDVDFEPIILHKPTQQEIEMALSKEFLSSRLTYKHKCLESDPMV